jgi:hypothetical protein
MHQEDVDDDDQLPARTNHWCDIDDQNMSNIDTVMGTIIRKNELLNMNYFVMNKEIISTNTLLNYCDPIFMNFVIRFFLSMNFVILSLSQKNSNSDFVRASCKLPKKNIDGTFVRISNRRINRLQIDCKPREWCLNLLHTTRALFWFSIDNHIRHSICYSRSSR